MMWFEGISTVFESNYNSHFYPILYYARYFRGNYKSNSDYYHIILPHVLARTNPIR